jgi:hypothetical protein
LVGATPGQQFRLVETSLSPPFSMQRHRNYYVDLLPPLPQMVGQQVAERPRHPASPLIFERVYGVPQGPFMVGHCS